MSYATADRAFARASAAYDAETPDYYDQTPADRAELAAQALQRAAAEYTRMWRTLKWALDAVTPDDDADLGIDTAALYAELQTVDDVMIDYAERLTDAVARAVAADDGGAE